jgi:adenylate cyclase
MRRLPSAPHCKLCAAPFEGPAGAVLRHVGFARFPGNPAICGNCIRDLNKVGVYGAEIPVSLLFADIRGSTAIGERLSATEFRAFLDRFYRMASKAILEHEGLVDKFVGDEVIGLFFPGVSGDHHAAAAIAAARSLLEAVAPEGSREGGEAIPLGAAVHTGDAFVGSTGTDGAVNDFTALGDVVNTTARLASEARSGELLVSEAAARGGGIDPASAARRTIDVRGRTAPITVLSFMPAMGRH